MKNWKNFEKKIGKKGHFLKPCLRAGPWKFSTGPGLDNYGFCFHCPPDMPTDIEDDPVRTGQTYFWKTHWLTRTAIWSCCLGWENRRCTLPSEQDGMEGTRCTRYVQYAIRYTVLVFNWNFQLKVEHFQLWEYVMVSVIVRPSKTFNESCRSNVELHFRSWQLFCTVTS